MRSLHHLLVALTLSVLVPGAAYAGSAFGGRPTSITDGDTLRFGDVRVRLSGIDAPEMSTVHGPAARDYLAQLVARSELRCEDIGQRSYDRIVARCSLPGGQDLAAAMVAAGWAFDWPNYSRGAYSGLEFQARTLRKGMFRASPLATREQFHPRGR